jgi:hypothetical protein
MEYSLIFLVVFAEMRKRGSMTGVVGRVAMYVMSCADNEKGDTLQLNHLACSKLLFH